MKLLTNILFAATGQVALIDLKPTGYRPWAFTTAISSLGLLLFFPDLWSIGALQGVAMNLIMMFCAPRNQYHIAKALFFTLFGSTFIVILILAQAPGILILPLFVLYCSKIWEAKDLSSLDKLDSFLTMVDENNMKDEAEQLRRLRSGPRPGRNLVEAGPVIGTFQGCEIVEFFVDEEGRKFTFTGTIQDDESAVLDDDMSFVTPPGLIYKLAASQSTPAG